MFIGSVTVGSALNMQGWNRYSYVGNDPLAFTDPNGFSWLSSFFHSVANFLTHNPIVRAIVQIAATVIVTAVLGPAALALGFVGGAGVAAAGVAAAAMSAAVVTGLSGGNLGQALKAGLIAGATALAFFEVGGLTNQIAGQDFWADHFQPEFGSPAYDFNVAAHALVGCASSVASGGSCKSGALSGGVSA